MGSSLHQLSRFCRLISRKRELLQSVLQLVALPTGGMIFPAIAYSSMAKHGFRWTVLIMAFVVTFNALVIITFAKPRIQARKARRLFDGSAFKELPYSFFALGIIFRPLGNLLCLFLRKFTTVSKMILMFRKLLTLTLGRYLWTNRARLPTTNLASCNHRYEWGGNIWSNHSLCARRPIFLAFFTVSSPLN